MASKDQLGDIFTKKGVCNEKIIRTVSEGRLDFPEEKQSKWGKLPLYPFQERRLMDSNENDQNSKVEGI